MSTLMVFTSTSIQQAVQSKAKIQTQLDDMSRVRDALKVVERDVNLAFHYRDLEMEFRESFKRSVQGRPTANQPPPNPFAPPPLTAQPNAPGYKEENEEERKRNRINPETQFIGSEDEMYFPTMNSARIFESSRQADSVKVGYFVESCSRPGAKGTSVNTNCLFRKSSNVVEADFTKGGEPIPLAEYVEEFKLRYKGPGKQDWVSQWQSTGGDGSTKGRFPSIVEVTLTTNRGTQTQPKKISMQIVIPVRFPNNDDTKKPAGGSNPGFPPPGT
jgi:hypothetical protein